MNKQTDTSEAGLESHITNYLVAQNGFRLRPHTAYNSVDCMDTELLFAFLEATQPKALAKLKTHHQDYALHGKINVVEHEDGKLVFMNVGSFIPASVEEVVISDAPEPTYRNPFLVEAMINLNMIDAIGSGIRRMFLIQRKKYFPMPEYTFEGGKVKLLIMGKVVDMAYARKLAAMPDLGLVDIMALDKFAKGKDLAEDEIQDLRSKHLIEGRKPALHISATVAKFTGDKASYIKQRGIDDDYCQKMILDYLKAFGEGTKEAFEAVLLTKISDILSMEQKKRKVGNLIQKLRRDKKIELQGRYQWILYKG